MANTVSNTPELTSEQVSKIITQPLLQASTFLACGPQIIDSSNPVRVPALAGRITDPGFTGEGEEIPERDVDLDEVTLLPETMESVKVLTKFSSELARMSGQTGIALDALIKTRLVEDVAWTLDTAFWSNTGDGVTTPKGLLAHAGTQTLPVDGELTLDHLLTAWGMALSGHVNMSALRWVMRPETFTELRKIKQGVDSNAYVLQADPTADGVFRLWGAPVVITDALPLSTGSPATARVVLADFSRIAVARDLAPSVKVLDQTYASTDMLAIRVVARYDMKPLTASAVVKLTNITV